MGQRPYAPDTESDEPWRAWRLSEVSIAVRRVGGEAVPHAHADAVQAAKAGWTRFDADKILVVLEESEAGDQNLSGVAKSGGEEPTDVRLSYSPQRGLTTDKKER